MFRRNSADSASKWKLASIDPSACNGFYRMSGNVIGTFEVVVKL